jgi:hypothetical protein
MGAIEPLDTEGNPVFESIIEVAAIADAVRHRLRMPYILRAEEMIVPFRVVMLARLTVARAHTSQAIDPWLISLLSEAIEAAAQNMPSGSALWGDHLSEYFLNMDTVQRMKVIKTA